MQTQIIFCGEWRMPELPRPARPAGPSFPSSRCFREEKVTKILTPSLLVVVVFVPLNEFSESRSCLDFPRRSSSGRLPPSPIHMHGLWKAGKKGGLGGHSLHRLSTHRRGSESVKCRPFVFQKSETPSEKRSRIVVAVLGAAGTSREAQLVAEL
ncbi:hypothetical protein TGP89_360120 [Toxoplasma gondii p89]|uniref:Uncharacterized protein n=2 Tax=Toxoplasma gondii TaxID=5811 RepID=A0A2T6J1U1_TOXGO|nr:hypothetical protein TGP89_360120 [Toxoplasma gondii p89]PUA91551.1 hypothetical protein TGBR9_360120 [Toxoplasma gondii TgCATBr9]